MKDFSTIRTPPLVAKQLAFRFKKFRKHQKLSQSQLAEKSQVSLGSIKRFEQKGQISLDSLLRLANIIGLLNDFELLFKDNIDEMKDVAKLFEK